MSTYTAREILNKKEKNRVYGKRPPSYWWSRSYHQSQSTLLINKLLPLSVAQLCRRTESQWGMHWHWVMGLYPGQLCWYTGPRWAWRGPADAHIINAERDECGSVHCCTSPQSRGETCISASAFTRLHPKKKRKQKRKDMILFAFHHNILSPYGQSSSWHGATVKCVPPTAHSYSASHHHLQK